MAGSENEIVFDHIALAAPEIACAPEFLVGQLGGLSGFGGPSPEYSWWHWDFDGGGRVEVLEPRGKPGGFIHRFLDSRGPGIHHATFKVPDLKKACSRAEGLGYTIVGFNDSEPSWKEAFLHPKQAMGVVVQLVEAGPGSGDDFAQRYPSPAPAEPRDRPASVSIVGLRMRSGNPEAVQRQWSGVLQGKATENENEIVFTWPTSGMRVAVTIEDRSDDVSESIEVRSDRTLSLPSEALPLLGARFVQV